MKIINRYFLRQMVAIFIMLLMVLTGLAWMVQIMSMMKLLLNYGIPVGSFIGLTMLMIPFIVSIIIPFVTFIAVIFVYNKMIADNEITVMAASTLSPGQLARPALMLAGVLTLIHLALNLFAVPVTQAQFYDTQWNLRYGLAHMKLQEAAFTELSPGLVVYVDKVSGHDLSQVMLADARNPESEMNIFAEKGKLVSTPRGLSIVMTNGSIQATGNAATTGTFDTFDMDLNVSEKSGEGAFRVRRLSSGDLLTAAMDVQTPKQQRAILSEIATRFIAPLMNLVLAALCALILLRTSLLRRRTSFAPAASVAAMACAMAAFMSATNMMNTISDLAILCGAVLLVLVILLGALFKK